MDKKWSDDLIKTVLNSLKSAIGLPKRNDNNDIVLNSYEDVKKLNPTLRVFLPKEINSQIRKLALGNINEVIILKNIYEDAQKKLGDYNKFNEDLNETATNNNLGIEAEKDGNIDKAIQHYEKNIIVGYPATHSYERLMKIYRRRRQYKDELRIIDTAIDVFSIENEKRFMKARDNPKNEKYLNQLYEAAETCTGFINDEGWYIFSPYPVMKYIERRTKAELLLKKQ